jgi:peroxiredoxin
MKDKGGTVKQRGGAGGVFSMGLAVALCLWGTAADARAQVGAGTGAAAPGFELVDLDGRTWTLEELRGGGPLLLDFGSVFCAQCQEALRWLETARQEYGPRGLAVAAVNVDGPKSARAVATVTASLAAGYPVLLDPEGAVAEAYGVAVIPYLVLLDGAGRVRAVHRGLDEDLGAVLGLEELFSREDP